MRRLLTRSESATHNLDGALGSFLLFTYLQVLDFLSTLAFLSHGVKEGNPMVRLALGVAPPALALASLKGLAVGFAFYCWRTGRRRLLFLANVFFALLVVWNLFALLAH